VAGVYETYDGSIVTLLDEPQATCTDPRHAEGSQIPDLAGLDTPGAVAQARLPRR